MCNRFKGWTTPEMEQYLQDIWDITRDNMTARYNVGVEQMYPIITLNPDSHPHLTEARWNLIPSFEHTAKSQWTRFNARGEEILEKKSYKAAAQKRRCLIPVDGWYEFEEVPGEKLKRPWAFELKSGKPFCFPGLWEEGNELHPPTFAMLTRDSNASVKRANDRMPIPLTDDLAKQWIAPGPLTPESLAPFIAPVPDERLTCYRVSQKLNSGRIDLPEVAARVEDEPRLPPPAPKIKGTKGVDPRQGELF